MHRKLQIRSVLGRLCSFKAARALASEVHGPSPNAFYCFQDVFVRSGIIGRNNPAAGCDMVLLTDRSTGPGRWSRLLIFAVICSLTFSLATRFVVTAHAPMQSSKSVQRHSLDPKRQHLNKDAALRAVPIVSFSILKLRLPALASAMRIVLSSTRFWMRVLATGRRRHSSSRLFADFNDCRGRFLAASGYYQLGNATVRTRVDPLEALEGGHTCLWNVC